MGQKVRPTGFRTGIMLDWQSTWYAGKQDFAELLIEDHKVRGYVKKKYGRSGISRIRIERTREKVVVYIYSARVGMIIGKKGQEVDKLTKDLEDLIHRHIEVKTMEVNRPEIDAQLAFRRDRRADPEPRDQVEHLLARGALLRHPGLGPGRRHRPDYSPIRQKWSMPLRRRRRSGIDPPQWPRSCSSTSRSSSAATSSSRNTWPTRRPN